MKQHAAWVIATTLASSIAAAAEPDAVQAQQFHLADRNASGAVSFEEFRNYAIDVFYRLDTDRDTTISPAEYPGVDAPVDIDTYNAALHIHFERFDADASQSLGLREWAAVPSADPAHPTHIEPERMQQEDGK